jgi:CTP:molybdopterin cytidylyltransferase MocA
MSHPWAIVLAGGEGSRISRLTRNPSGIVVPKQFCRLRDGRTLLRRALDRALRRTDPGRVLVVVMDHHRSWWERELSGLPAENVLVQEESRGTAGAIRLGLDHVLARHSKAVVLVLPSDHDVEREAALGAALARAGNEARTWPRHLILIGIVTDDADPEYGWIVPAAPIRDGSQAVASFVEKPDRDRAAVLLRRGALVNTFMLAARAWTLRELYRAHLPELEGGNGGPSRDFGRDLLPRAVPWLRVMRAPPCGWTDLGTPRRLRRWLELHDEAFVWGERAALPLRAPGPRAGAPGLETPEPVLVPWSAGASRPAETRSA